MNAVLKIMIVDDNAEAISALRESLCFELAQELIITEAYNGREALEAIKHEHFDLIICDEVMPLLSGSNFIRKAREQGITSPIMLLSGLELRDIKKSIDQTSGVEVMTKPFDLDLLMQTFTRLVGLQKDQVV